MVLWVMLMHGLRTVCMSDRQQSVKYSGSFSSWSPVRIGVPQGSTLGPLLFSVFLNDLPSVVDYVQINMHADDTKLHCCGKNLLHVQDNFQFDLIIRFSTGYKQKGYN